MACKQISKTWNGISSRKKYIVDSAEDIASLPHCCTGSYAVVANSGDVYIVNASEEWVKMGSGSSTAILALAEEASF